MKANALAMETIEAMDVPADNKTLKNAYNHVGDVVSSQIGNTRAVASSDYINPAVFAPWEKIS